jgi:hypothetical protein
MMVAAQHIEDDAKGNWLIRHRFDLESRLDREMQMAKEPSLDTMMAVFLALRAHVKPVRSAEAYLEETYARIMPLLSEVILARIAAESDHRAGRDTANPLLTAAMQARIEEEAGQT